LRNRFLLFLLSLCFVHVAEAQSITLSGNLNNPANTALVGSDMGAPFFGDDFEIANNVALYVISVPVSGQVKFLSKGFAAGGVDPYFTLFQGTGNSATFLGSNYAKAFSTGGDFNLSFILAPGEYTVALGAFANMSFPENLGTGTLGDGFISLGEPYALGRTYYYELEVGLGGQGQAVAVPTLTEWGMVTMIVLLGGCSIYHLKKERPVSEGILNNRA
jgi:hypothetical protein